MNRSQRIFSHYARHFPFNRIDGLSSSPILDLLLNFGEVSKVHLPAIIPPAGNLRLAVMRFDNSSAQPFEFEAGSFLLARILGILLIFRSFSEKAGLFAHFHRGGTYLGCAKFIRVPRFWLEGQ